MPEPEDKFEARAMLLSVLAVSVFICLLIFVSHLFPLPS